MLVVCLKWEFLMVCFSFFGRGGYVLFDCGDFYQISDGLVAYEPSLDQLDVEMFDDQAGLA